MSGFDVVIAGGGIVGATTAYAMVRRGLRVLLLDQNQVPNPLSSSSDHAHIFHLTFGKDAFYSELAAKALPAWRQFQEETGEELFLPTGMLNLAVGDGRYETSCLETLKSLNIPARKLSAQELGQQYRIFRARAFRFAVFHPGAGIVWSRKAVGAFVNFAQRKGARVEAGARVVKVLRGKTGVEGLKDAQGRVWRGEHYVFTVGPWAGQVLSDWRIPLMVTRQESLYFRPPRNQGRYRSAHFPVFSIMSKGLHGFPVHIHGFMKMGFHREGPKCRSVAEQALPDPKFQKQCRTFLKQAIPDLSDFTDLEGQVSYYTRTSDGDFILDKLPGTENAWAAVGFCGRAPIFAPVVARALTALSTGEKPDFPLHRFRLERLRAKKGR